MPNEPPTIGEIVRRLDRIEADMTRNREHAVSLNTYQVERKTDRERIDNTRSDLVERVSSLKSDLIERLAKLNTDLSKDIAEIQESLKWARRASVGGLVFPLIVIVATFVLLGR